MTTPIENGSLPTFCRQRNWQRPQQNFNIEPQIPTLNVFKIQIHVDFEGRVVAGGYLPKAGQPPLHIQSSVMLELVALEIFGWVGSWPDKAHVSSQHLPELPEFVNAVFAQKAD